MENSTSNRINLRFIQIFTFQFPSLKYIRYRRFFNAPPHFCLIIFQFPEILHRRNHNFSCPLIIFPPIDTYLLFVKLLINDMLFKRCIVQLRASKLKMIKSLITESARKNLKFIRNIPNLISNKAK